MVTQNVNLKLTENGIKSYLSSITSLVTRLPPFDFAEHNGLYYMRIKSDQIMYAQNINPSNKRAIGSEIVIVPTDDERLKIIIIPMDAVGVQNPGQTKLETV